MTPLFRVAPVLPYLSMRKSYKGGIRPRKVDGFTEHLLKSKWKLGQTRTIRVPLVLAEQLLELAHKLDER